MNIEISINLAFEIIKKWESLIKLLKNGNVTAYLDPVGIPTIGWGTTQYLNGKVVKMGDIITQKQAYDEAIGETRKKAIAIQKLLIVEVTNEQMAAMISMAYNMGVSGMTSKNFFKKLNSEPNFNPVQISNIIKDTAVTAKGVFLRGLVNRRADEAKLFLTKSTEAEKKKSNPFRKAATDFYNYFGFFITGQ